MRLLHHRDGRPAQPLTVDDLVDLYRWPDSPGSAWVRSNFLATLDGSVQGLDGRSGSINTASDHSVFALHRALTDVILVGAGTVRGEGYRAADLRSWQRSLRQREDLTPYPTLVVVTSSLHLDPSLVDPPYEHGPVLVVTTSAHEDAATARFTDRGAAVWRCPGSSVDLGWLLDQLVRRGLRRVLCEGGPVLHRDLLAAGLLDELSLTLAPSVVGGIGKRSTAGAALPSRLDLDLGFLLLGDDQTVFASYRRPGR